MYRINKDSTLKSYSKDLLIQKLRCAEHNWANEKEGAEILSKRLSQLVDKLTESGAYTTAQINHMLALREYGETL